MALGLATALSESDMRLTIKIPQDDGFETGDGQTRFFVGVDAGLVPICNAAPDKNNFEEMVEKANANRQIIPYVSDGITQVLACCDPLDSKIKDWPSKLTVFNYGTWYDNNSIFNEANEGNSLIDNKRWFIATYNCSGAEGGITNGSVTLHSYDTRALLSSSRFGCLLKP